MVTGEMFLLYLIVVLTVVSHDVFQGVKVRHLGLVSAEDFGSRTEVVREVDSVSLPHHTIPTQTVDLNMKWYVVGRPISCAKKKSNNRQRNRQFSTNTVDVFVPYLCVRLESDLSEPPSQVSAPPLLELHP